MSEEKFKSTINEIKNIFLFLTEQEPTPDDEIDAREKLVALFNTLKEVNNRSNLEDLISETLNKLENWDTLDYWFIEVEGLADNIKKIIDIVEKKEEEQPIIEESEKPEDSESTASVNKIDITQIVAQVSQQFKGEIGSLKKQIDQLQKELEKKEKVLEKIKVEKVSKSGESTSKKKSKLPPPKIVIPAIKKPQKVVKKGSPPKSTIKVAKESSIKPESIQIKPVLEEKEALKPKIAPISSREKPKLGSFGVVKPKASIKPAEKPKIASVSVDKPKIAPVSVDKPKIAPVSADKPKIAPVSADKPKIAPVSVDKPKIVPVSADKPKIVPVSADKPKIVPVSADKPKIVPVSADKPKISHVISEVPIIQPVSDNKPKITPFKVEKPSISPVKIEEIATSSIKPKGTDLFNVFSSVGEQSTASAIQPIEPLETVLAKGKKKKGEKKRKRGERPGVAGTASSFGFGGPEAGLEEDFLSGGADALPADKDSLYQELIALEGRRYSLEKSFKELEKSYQKGTIDDFEYKSQSDQLKFKLKEISDRINNIRRIISSL